MITSLLSLYILSHITTHLINTDTVKDPDSFIRSTSFELSSLANSQPVPVKKLEYVSPVINAKTSIAIDIGSGEILFEKNAHQRLPIGSLTKLMTALIILEENNLSNTTKISGNAAGTTGSTMYLKTGEEITVENLLYGTVIHSANDAAVALAEYNAGTVDKFVEKMNLKALKLGLVNTHFSNPVGLDDRNNYSSAYDLAKLGKYIYQKQFIKKAAVIREMEVSSVSKDYKHQLSSTDELLGNTSYVFKGLKTGTTDQAGQCIVTIAENEKGNEIMTVLLNSPNRFTEAKILVDWILRAYTW